MSRPENQCFFEIGKAGNAKLFIGPRPQTDRLDDWAHEAQRLNINHVVSLIEEAEVRRHNLSNEGNILSNYNIGFTHFPVDDFDIPDGGLFRKLIDDLNERLKSGQTLFLHCAGGVGRAGQRLPVC